MPPSECRIKEAALQMPPSSGLWHYKCRLAESPERNYKFRSAEDKFRSKERRAELQIPLNRSLQMPPNREIRAELQIPLNRSLPLSRSLRIQKNNYANIV
jgi:hypothetical protein